MSSVRRVSSVSSNQRGRRIPPFIRPPKREPDGHDIKRIDEIIKNARATWFLLLGALVFAGITLLGVKDVDFFAAQSETKLPLVGVSVPVEYFFWAGCAGHSALCVFPPLPRTALGGARPGACAHRRRAIVRTDFTLACGRMGAEISRSPDCAQRKSARKACSSPSQELETNAAGDPPSHW